VWQQVPAADVERKLGASVLPITLPVTDTACVRMLEAFAYPSALFIFSNHRVPLIYALGIAVTPIDVRYKITRPLNAFVAQVAETICWKGKRF
jgi:hypothetical protein